jgi:uncharacterized membrane protein
VTPEPQPSRFVAPFVTGIVFLAPVILTIILVQWIAGYVVAILGPETLLGGTLARGGMLLFQSPTLGFITGLGAALLIIWLFGLAIQSRAPSLQAQFDRLLGRLPVIGGVYRPLAQLVRMIGKSPSGELKGMTVCIVRFGNDVEIMGLLATPQIYDFGTGPQHLVMLPTAPVPIGGALMFVAAGNVRITPELGVDDMAKFYVSMGTISPLGLGVRH